jgi:dTDP-4-dehydrorhamnose 3,5-epimerase
MSRFQVRNTPIAGVRVIERARLADERGFLTRLFCADELAAAGWLQPVAQINHTLTRLQGTVRGMHFQRPPHAEAKLVSCIRGRVWDVAVDLRQGSPTFLTCFGTDISADNGCALMIPDGVAHGFQTLTADCELVYLHSAAYHPASEGGVRPNDPAVPIQWPLTITEMSARDRAHPLLTPQFQGLCL